MHQDFDKDILSGMSDRLISTVNSLLENHVLHYSCIDSGQLNSLSAINCLPFSIKVHTAGDVEFLSSLVWIAMTCLHSGGYTTIPSGAPDAKIGLFCKKWGRHFVNIQVWENTLEQLLIWQRKERGRALTKRRGRIRKGRGRGGPWWISSRLATKGWRMPPKVLHSEWGPK